MKLKDPSENTRRVRVTVMQDDSRAGDGPLCDRASKSLTVYDAGRDEVLALIEGAIREAQNKDEREKRRDAARAR